MKRLAGSILAATVVLLPVPAIAQAYQCKVPSRVTVPAIPRGGEPRAMQVTGYTLALSWSPEFCKDREANASQRFQCSGRSGYFGFVVHGLWPEGPGNRWPQWCPTPRAPLPTTARKNLCMMPSSGLIARQWAKHGACMTQKPETYFNVTRILWDSLKLPDFDTLSHKRDLNAGDIREVFVSANDGWRADAVGVKLNSRGWLQEMRLCYDKRFRPAKCDSRRFGAQDKVRVKIWRGL